jgi:hypothetical protein
MFQDTHSLMELNSRSSQEWLLTEPSSGMNTLVDTNTDSESETLHHGTTDNGLSSTGEQELSEHLPTERRLWPTKKDMASESMSLLP